MRKIGSILPKAIDQTEVLKTARGQTAMADWDKIVGPQLALKCFPDRFRNGVLWVVVDGSAWGQEILFRKERILHELNKRVGEKDFFKELRVSMTRKKESESD
jgi:predicted nucleic acid-binding Zn ribbon protein